MRSQSNSRKWKENVFIRSQTEKTHLSIKGEQTFSNNVEGRTTPQDAQRKWLQSCSTVGRQDQPQKARRGERVSRYAKAKVPALCHSLGVTRRRWTCGRWTRGRRLPWRSGCSGLDVPSPRTHSGPFSDLGCPGDIRTWSGHKCSDTRCGPMTRSVSPPGVSSQPGHSPGHQAPREPAACALASDTGTAELQTGRRPSHRRPKRPREERLRAKRVNLTEGKLTPNWLGFYNDRRIIPPRKYSMKITASFRFRCGSDRGQGTGDGEVTVHSADSGTGTRTRRDAELAKERRRPDNHDGAGTRGAPSGDRRQPGR